MDNSYPEGAVITMTIWGDMCQQRDYKVGDVIVMKNVKVSLYGGKSLNSGFECKVLLNEEIKH